MPTETWSAPRGRDGAQSLARGLDILRILVDAEEPMTATEIAAAVGVHPSSASRILGTLTDCGYVRKLGYRKFVPDYGVLAIAERAIRSFPLSYRTRDVLTAIANDHRGHMVSIGTLWRDRLLYLGLVEHGHDVRGVSIDSYPLHLSSIGLRLLVDLPEETALSLLRDSRQRFGWERPTPSVPATEADTLAAVRNLVRYDALALDGWQPEGRVAAAIPFEVPGEPPAALSISGPAGPDEATLQVWLQDARRRVETALKSA